MAGHSRNWPISKPSSELAVIGCQPRSCSRFVDKNGALNSTIKRLSAGSIVFALLDSEGNFTRIGVKLLGFKDALIIFSQLNVIDVHVFVFLSM